MGERDPCSYAVAELTEAALHELVELGRAARRLGDRGDEGGRVDLTLKGAPFRLTYWSEGELSRLSGTELKDRAAEFRRRLEGVRVDMEATSIDEATGSLIRTVDEPVESVRPSVRLERNQRGASFTVLLQPDDPYRYGLLSYVGLLRRRLAVADDPDVRGDTWREMARTSPGLAVRQLEEHPHLARSGAIGIEEVRGLLERGREGVRRRAMLLLGRLDFGRGSEGRGERRR